MRNCLGIIPYTSNLPVKEPADYYTHVSQIPGKEKLLIWAPESKSEIQKYLQNSSLIVRKLTSIKTPLERDLLQLGQYVNYKGLDAMNTLVGCISICPLTSRLHEGRVAILKRDLDSNGFYPEIIEQVIIPAFLENQDIKEVTEKLAASFYNDSPTDVFGRAIVASLNKRKPYHLELVEESVDKRSPHFELTKKTVIEAYLAKLISKWTRVIYLHAALDHLAKNTSELDEAKDPATGEFTKERLTIFFINRLINLRPEHFSGVLTENHKEKIPNTESAVAFGSELINIITFFKKEYRECIFPIEQQAEYILKNAINLFNLHKAMSQFGI